MRVVRILRAVELLDSLYVMITAIKGMAKILGWAVALLVVILATESLFLTQILFSTVFDNAQPGDTRSLELFEYFGTFSRSLVSMFELTLANWPLVTRMLSEEVSEWFFVLCVLHKLTIGFALVGVITGVILQETFKVAQMDDVMMMRQKKKYARRLKSKMMSLLASLDHDGDERLDLEEWKAIGKVPEVKLWLASLDIETDQLEVLFRLIDADNNGYITADELLHRMPRIRGSARGIDVMALG